MYTE